MATHVITLLADPKTQKLSEDFVQQIAHAAHAEQVEWLKEGVACDLFVPATLMSYTLPMFDSIMQPIAHRRKKLLLADMDSTMVSVECLDELADFAGKKKEVAAITERAMNGELNFEQALIERVAMLQGLPETALEQCYRERVRMTPGAKELVAAMKKNGAYTVLISGGFTFFTSRVAAELGLDAHYGNTLEIADGKLTGRVIPPIIGKEAKLETLQRLCKERGITPEDTMAIGDGANDVPMLLAAGLGVAYHAKPHVQAQVKTQINYCDLSALVWVV